MIRTIEWLKKEADGIASSWNGSDERFSFEGDTFTEDDAHTAIELSDKLKEVEELAKALSL